MSNTPTPADIEALAQQHLKAFAQFSSGEVWFEGEVEFARAIEAEVRKQDDALIKQMLEALTLTERYLEIEVGSAYGRDTHISKIKEYESRLKKHKKCITAARNRLENT